MPFGSISSGAADGFCWMCCPGSKGPIYISGVSDPALLAKFEAQVQPVLSAEDGALHWTCFDSQHAQLLDGGRAVSRRRDCGPGGESVGEYRTAIVGAEGARMRQVAVGDDRHQRYAALFEFVAGDNAMIGLVRHGFDVNSCVVAADTRDGWGYFCEDGDGKHAGKWTGGPGSGEGSSGAMPYI